MSEINATDRHRKGPEAELRTEYLLLNLILLFFLLSFSWISCSGDGGSRGGNNNDGEPIDNPVEIVWVDDPQSLISYEYIGGILSAINFHRNFIVQDGSGNIQISATLVDELNSVNPIDQIEDMFYVEEGIEYEIIVNVHVEGQRHCDPSDNDFMIFNSISASDTRETMVGPMLEGDPITGQIDAFCVMQYAINAIMLN